MKHILNYLIAGTAFFAVACGGNPTPKKETTIKPVPERIEFLLPDPPIDLAREEEPMWYKLHFWDRFDFADTLFLRKIDTTQMVNAYASYINLLWDEPQNGLPIDTLMRKASASRPMLDYFAWLGKIVLHDPNSPLRNDEFYIPVLNAVLASPYYDEYERIAPAYELKIARQNRIGHKANEVIYTTADGRKHSLHGLHAEYTLLFISNPGCPMCREIREAISSSPMLNEMLEQDRLQILVLHPDADLKEWREHRSEFPSDWIYAYDDGCQMEKNGTYNLNAIPALYLLDSDKKVLVKDSTDIPYIEEIIDRRE